MRTKLKRALFGVMAGIMVANTPLTTLAAYTPANEPDAITREPERSCYRRRSRNPWRNSQFISMQVDTIHRSLLRREECAK